MYATTIQNPKNTPIIPYSEVRTDNYSVTSATMPRKNNGKPPVGAKAARMRYAASQQSSRNSPLMAASPAGAVHGKSY